MNKHRGSNFDDFLKEQEILEECDKHANKNLSNCTGVVFQKKDKDIVLWFDGANCDIPDLSGLIDVDVHHK